MKLLYTFTLVFFLFSCSQHSNDSTETYAPPQFKIDSANFDVDIYPQGITKFNENIIVYARGGLRVYSTKMVIDSAMNESMHNDLSYFEDLWVSNDTVYTARTKIVKYGKQKGDWKASVFINYWTAQRGKWEVLKEFPITNKEWGIEKKFIPIFEDDQYVVRHAHRGEWGGSIYFTNKKTGKIYSTRTNYIGGVHKLNDSYFIVSTSLVPKTRILKINDPEKMYDLSESPDKDNCAWHTLDIDSAQYYMDLEGYDQGVETLLDTSEIWCLASFQYKAQLFYLYSDMKQTYLGYLDNGELTPIDTLIDQWTYNMGSRNMVQNPNFFPIVCRNYNGFISRKDSLLTVNRLR